MFRNAFLLGSSGLMILTLPHLFLGPDNDRAECQALLEKYNGAFPARDDSMRARYAECYYLICGVRLKLDP